MLDHINKLKSKIIARKRSELNKKKIAVTNQIYGLVKEIQNNYLERKSTDESIEKFMLGDLSLDSSIRKSSEAMMSSSNDREVPVKEFQIYKNQKTNN